MLRKILLLILVFSFNTSAYSHILHYKKLNLLKFDLYRNNNFIGTHTFHFKRNKEKLSVESEIKFEIKKLGIVLYKYYAKGIEEYENDKLLSFKSNTKQNKREKFCEIKIVDDEYIINGSSYNGTAPEDFIIGTWWNHSIIEKNFQISAISGRIIGQKVQFIGKEKLNINGKLYTALHFNFSSSDPKLSKDKKLNTDVWYEEETLNWIKASFSKTGLWEYRLKNIK